MMRKIVAALVAIYAIQAISFAVLVSWGWGGPQGEWNMHTGPNGSFPSPDWLGINLVYAIPGTVILALLLVTLSVMSRTKTSS